MFKILKKKKIHYEILNNAVSESMVLGHGFVIILFFVKEKYKNGDNMEKTKNEKRIYNMSECIFREWVKCIVL